ncbi:MAG: NAD-dependent epimerase/dehydratase family protein [Magnetococcales bacterium]|nr:NAD-dependent epimerase/dehydratase family protein [Magnetococcales bacterium]
MKRYLITGGCGFIGSHISDALLARGDQVRILDDFSTGHRSNVSSECEIIEGCITDHPTVCRVMEGVDGCFHMAAVSSVQRSVEDWPGTHTINQSGTINLFDAARNHGRTPRIPVVYASSAAIYGNNPNTPLTEKAERLPLTAYGADKLGSELHAHVAGTVHGVPTLGCRFFNVFGPRQDPNSPYSGVISIFLKRIQAGESITIFGDGSQIRDFIHVSDVVRALLAAMERATPEGGAVNVCTGNGISILELAHTLFQVLGTTTEIVHGPPRTGDIHTSIGNPEGFSNRLGLQAKVSLSAGLEQTLTFLKSD